MLLHYEQWDLPQTTVLFALAQPVKAGIDPAIDYMGAWLSNLKLDESRGLVMSATNALAAAASNGNQKARATLERFREVAH